MLVKGAPGVLLWFDVCWFYPHPSGFLHWRRGYRTIAQIQEMDYHIDGLMQERRNSSALAMELRLSCSNPSI